MYIKRSIGYNDDRILLRSYCLFLVGELLRHALIFRFSKVCVWNVVVTARPKPLLISRADHASDLRRLLSCNIVTLLLVLTFSNLKKRQSACLSWVTLPFAFQSQALRLPVSRYPDAENGQKPCQWRAGLDTHQHKHVSKCFIRDFLELCQKR